jgi:hypothetical protein
MRTWILRLLILNAVIGVIWFGVPFLKSPATQALEQHARLLEFASHRRWERAVPLMAVDYHDAWDMKREEAIAIAMQMLQSFLTLDLQWQLSSVKMEGNTAIITGRMKVAGNGLPPSAEILNYINDLREPFVFTWRKDGWKPRDWRLVHVTQPELARFAP